MGRTLGCLPSGSCGLKEKTVKVYGFTAIHRLWLTFCPFGPMGIEYGDIFCPV